MQEYEDLEDQEDTGIPAVYPMATSTDTEHDKHMMTAQELMHEPANESYFH